MPLVIAGLIGMAAGLFRTSLRLPGGKCRATANRALGNPSREISPPQDIPTQTVDGSVMSAVT